ncbi:MAG TPA: extracellular solute-binding protein [Thermomicrobiales bacterium]|nr:extracellular solute-binding protein [Thermomicrobiales bacterium]
MNEDTNPSGSALSRRGFLKAAGAAAGAVAVGGALRSAKASPVGVPFFNRGGRFAGGKLTVLYMQSGTYDEAARLLAPEFKDATGATVEVVAFPYQNLHDNAANDLITQTGAYDVMDVAFQWDGEFAPYLTPLDDDVKQAGISADAFIPNIWKLSGNWLDKRNGIPNANDAMGILYRTDLYKAAEVTVPKTWQAYNDNAKKLTGDGVYGASWVGIGEQLQSSWLSRYWESGQPLCDKDWRPAFVNDAGVHAIQLLRDALPFCPPGMPGWDIPTANNAVLTGEVAQAELWPSFIRADARNPDKSKIIDKWALTPFPGPSELSIWSLGIPQTSQQKDLAWEWIKSYTSPENAKRFALQFGIGSPQLATWSDSELTSKFPEYPQILAAIKAGKPIWRIPQFPAAWDVLQKELEKTVYQNADPKATLQGIADEWNKLLDQNPPTAPYVE